MSLYAKYNIVDKEWSFDVLVEPYSSHLEIGFEGSGYPLFFNDLSFGFSLETNAGTLQRSYPENGVEYISTDQAYLSSDAFSVVPDETVTLNVWANHGKVFSEAQKVFVVSRPDKPFDSWIWNGAEWIAPIERPNDDGVYVWSEQNGNWVAIESPGYEVE